jgi:hypothetical protein
MTQMRLRIISTALPIAEIWSSQIEKRKRSPSNRVEAHPMLIEAWLCQKTKGARRPSAVGLTQGS